METRLLASSGHRRSRNLAEREAAAPGKDDRVLSMFDKRGDITLVCVRSR